MLTYQKLLCNHVDMSGSLLSCLFIKLDINLFFVKLFDKKSKNDLICRVNILTYKGSDKC